MHFHLRCLFIKRKTKQYSVLNWAREWTLLNILQNCLQPVIAYYCGSVLFEYSLVVPVTLLIVEEQFFSNISHEYSYSMGILGEKSGRWCIFT